MKSIHEFLDLLEDVKQIGDGRWMALCPVHNDHNRSLAVSEAKDKILTFCHAGCSFEQILAALNLEPKDLFLNGHKEWPEQRKIVAIYHYEGFEVVRTQPKGFFQRRLDSNGKYVNDLKGVKLRLYHHDELRPAIDSGINIYVAEGEKDVDRLRTEGFTATCNAMGAGKWKDEYSQALMGADVVIIPDNDTPGRDHAAKVARSCYGKAARIRLLELPGAKDVSDWLDNGHTAVELKELTSQAPEYEPVQDVNAVKDVEEVEDNETEYSGNRTDTGNAEYFTRMHRNLLRYDHKRTRWLKYSRHYYVEDSDGLVNRLAIKAVRKRYKETYDITDLEERKAAAKWCIDSEQKTRIDALLSISKSLKPIADSGNDFDSNHWLLAVANGVIDLKTGLLRDGQPEDRITLHSSIVYDPNARMPSRWLQFLDEIFSGNKELINWIWRALGYSITSSTKEQLVFILYGVGANGKSKLFDTMRYIMGDYAFNAPFSTFEMDSRSSIPNDMAALDRKRFITSIETNDGTRLNESRIKTLSGEDDVTARFLHHEFFTFKPVGKLWLGINHKPRINDDSYGFWRRVRLIPMLRQFVKGKNADENLIDKLLAESQSILKWLVEGCLEYQRIGLSDIPEAIQSSTSDYQCESDPIGQFLLDVDLFKDSKEVLSSVAYKQYTAWAEEQGLQKREVLSNNLFGRKMAMKFNKKHTMKGKVFLHNVVNMTDFLSVDDGFTHQNEVLALCESSCEENLKIPSNPSYEAKNPSSGDANISDLPVSEKSESLVPDAISQAGDTGSGDLPDCFICGRCEWAYTPTGDLKCPCGKVIKGGG